MKGNKGQDTLIDVTEDVKINRLKDSKFHCISIYY